MKIVANSATLTVCQINAYGATDITSTTRIWNSWLNKLAYGTGGVADISCIVFIVIGSCCNSGCCCGDIRAGEAVDIGAETECA